MSIMLYGKVKKFYVPNIEKLINSGEYAIERDATDEVFDRMVAGLFASDFTPPWAIHYAKTQHS